MYTMLPLTHYHDVLLIFWMNLLSSTFKNDATCLKPDYTFPSKINRATNEALMSFWNIFWLKIHLYWNYIVWFSNDPTICFYSRFLFMNILCLSFAKWWNDFYESCRAFTQYRPIYIQIKPVFCSSTLQIWIFAIFKMSFSVVITWNFRQLFLKKWHACDILVVWYVFVL